MALQGLARRPPSALAPLPELLLNPEKNQTYASACFKSIPSGSYSPITTAPLPIALKPSYRRLSISLAALPFIAPMS